MKNNNSARIWGFMRSLGMEQAAMFSSSSPSLSLIQNQQHGTFDCSQTQNTSSDWIKPDAGWVKINVDGAVSNCLQASCRGVLRNADGSWLKGFSWNFGTFSSANVFLTELMAVKTAVEAAMSLDLARVIVESDSLEVVDFLHSTDLGSHRYSQIALDILHLQREHGALVFQYALRECNSIVDYIAKFGLSLPYGGALV